MDGELGPIARGGRGSLEAGIERYNRNSRAAQRMHDPQTVKVEAGDDCGR
jgi:hypothetical protein